MLDKLIQMITQQGQNDVVNNPAIPNEYNNKIIGEAGSSIFSVLQSVLAGGGLKQILRLFSGRNRGIGGGNNLSDMMNNPVVQNIIESFSGRLTQQYNLSPETAQSVGTSLIPQVLNQFAQKVSDPSDASIDMNGVIQSLTGGQATGTDFNQLANKLSASGDTDGDGDVDLQDIIGSVSGAAKQQQQKPGGNVMDMIGGLLR
jgi:hypothetical protein